MTKEQILRELLDIYKTQAIDLSIMYKIEFGNDVLAEINRLQNMLMEMEEQELWDQTLMDGLEDEPPYVSDDFQIGPDGANEHKEKDMKNLTIEIVITDGDKKAKTTMDVLEYKTLKELHGVSLVDLQVDTLLEEIKKSNK
jgi:hypothetical protein